MGSQSRRPKIVLCSVGSTDRNMNRKSMNLQPTFEGKSSLLQSEGVDVGVSLRSNMLLGSGHSGSELQYQTDNLAVGI